ncbi:CHASE2 domain-containing protein [Legionella sp. km772]|uniref:CHASE2 domain-containing protein n=1 Tax=Legionella sp. km772 TaxID=2498111 RepID=UPI000F8F5B1F|nr:adenylate/guanylate cyclase domain-containing protein [Legionella sp. km772]RUR06105.1 adenylate/guanylate cyclase domain-containing protein [Legionella sp. km772]
MKKILKNNGIAFLIGFIFVGLLAWLYISSNSTTTALVNTINNAVYDHLLRANLDKLPPIKQNNIAIVAIDDQSIAEQGRWPWSREKMASLVNKLHQMQAAVVAFDIIFSEPERNIMTQALSSLDKTPAASDGSLHTSLKQLVPYFNFDEAFAKSLSQGDFVLGMVLDAQNDSTSGSLPAPLLTLSQEQANSLAIPTMNGYLGNIAVLQNAAHQAGFLNAAPDDDGTLRQTNLIMNYHNNIYPSLALEATRLYLLSDQIQLVTANYGRTSVLEGLQLDQTLIPTDETGSILIPFRVGAYAYPYISASDILENRVKEKDIASKIIFIGATATGLGDLKPSSIANNYPGVEVHASIASAILDNYFPAKPVWGRGLEFVLIIGLGVIGALLFPFLNAFILSIIALLSILGWLFTTTWLWTTHHLVLTLLFPLIAVLFLAFMNMVNSYLSASKQRKEIKSVFGQYVPQQHIDTILKSSNESLLEGESKELTVLFSDIRGFTTMSEKLTAVQLKAQLNEYLSAMTAVIFALGGTIDKYVGDMIMAFWNAPISDHQHAKKTILAGLEMQRTLQEVNKIFLEKNLPDIHIGIGINTGMINVGDMGSRYRRAYTAIGDSVNLASRLEGMCRPYEVDILVGEDTYKETKDDFLFLYVDKVKVKGKTQGVDIYLPLGLATEVSPEQIEEVNAHAIAVQHYFNQEWEIAESLFTTLHTKYPNRYLYEVYLDRVKTYKENPPGENWDGAYVALTK